MIFGHFEPTHKSSSYIPQTHQSVLMIDWLETITGEDTGIIIDQPIISKNIYLTEKIKKVNQKPHIIKIAFVFLDLSKYLVV